MGMPMFAEVGPLIMDDKVLCRAQDIMNDDEDKRVFKNVQITQSNCPGVPLEKIKLAIMNEQLKIISDSDTTYEILY